MSFSSVLVSHRPAGIGNSSCLLFKRRLDPGLRDSDNSVSEAGSSRRGEARAISDSDGPLANLNGADGIHNRILLLLRCLVRCTSNASQHSGKHKPGINYFALFLKIFSEVTQTGNDKPFRQPALDRTQCSRIFMNNAA
jgi:hypothetical protein